MRVAFRAFTIWLAYGATVLCSGPAAFGDDEFPDFSFEWYREHFPAEFPKFPLDSLDEMAPDEKRVFAAFKDASEGNLDSAIPALSVLIDKYPDNPLTLGLIIALANCKR